MSLERIFTSKPWGSYLYYCWCVKSCKTVAKVFPQQKKLVYSTLNLLFFFLVFISCRFKLHFVQMRSGGPRQLHKMRWGQGWATSMKQSGRVFQSFYAVLTRLWRTWGLMNVFLTMPHLFNFLLGWVVIVMVRSFSMAKLLKKAVRKLEEKEAIPSVYLPHSELTLTVISIVKHFHSCFS